MTVIREYEFSELVAENQERVRQELQRLNPLWKRDLGLREAPFELRGDSSRLQIKAKNVCGQIEIGNHVLEIVPKYLIDTKGGAATDWRSSFLKVLNYSETTHFELTAANRLPGGANETSLIDVVAQGYADQLSEALVQGPPTTYHDRRELRTSARGRLDVRRLYPQITKNPSKLWFNTTELSSENELGRILQWACGQFAATVRSQPLQNSLLELMGRFRGVTTKRPTEVTLYRYSLSPQHRRFEQPLQIARWLFDQSNAGYSGRKINLPGILFKSSKIFEEFVHTAFQEVSSNRGWSLDSSSRTLAEGTYDQTIEPDHVIKSADKITVYDSKYVDVNSSRSFSPKSTHFYQVLAYGRALRAEQVGLVYPRIAETIPEPWTILTPGYPSRVVLVGANPTDFIRDKDSFLSDIESVLSNSLD